MKKIWRPPRQLNDPDESVPHCVPLSQVQSPGRILHLNKGKPAFYSRFIEVYDDFKASLVLEKGDKSRITKEECQDLLDSIQKMLLYYKVELHLFPIEEKYAELLEFLKVMVETIFTLSRDLFLKSDLRHLYVFVKQKQTMSNQIFLANQKNSFIVEKCTSNEQITQKVQDLVKCCVMKKFGPGSDENKMIEKSFSGRCSDVFRTSLQDFQSCLKNKTLPTSTSVTSPKPSTTHVNLIKTFVTRNNTEVSLDDTTNIQPKFRRKFESPRVVFGGISVVSFTTTTDSLS